QAADLGHLRALAAEMDDDRRQAEVALRHAAYHEVISDFPAALAAAQEAVRWAEGTTNLHQTCEGLVAWARALWRQGRLEEARQKLEAALALARRHGNRSGEATSLHYLGAVLYFLDDCHRARDYWEEALTIRRSLGDRLGEATSLSNLVAVYDGLGDFARGKACCEQALAIHRMIGNRWGEANTLTNLANIYYALGDLVTAREYHERARTLFQSLGDRRGEALAAENLGLVLHDLGQDQMARYYCEQALATERLIGDRRGEGYSLNRLGLALEGLGELEAASRAYQEALSLRREIGQAASGVDDLAGLARVALKQGQVDQALAHVEELLDWMATQGVQGIEYPLRIYLTGADVLTAANRPERAAELLSAAHSLLLEQAAHISDEPTQRAFLEKVPLHRQVRARFLRRG
ncbi:MAG TPA: hypothetical protein DEP84_13725, partial [Chloroflexi bacterium]|nr:hypothetical protein [Chloroflexota bacterium]